jgi:hypothetical protein
MKVPIYIDMSLVVMGLIVAGIRTMLEYTDMKIFRMWNPSRMLIL